MNRNRMWLGAGVVALGLGVVVAAPVRADVLGFYQFGTPGQETTAESGPAYAPTTANPLVNVSSVTDPAGTVGIEISNAGAPANVPFLRIDPQGSSTNPDVANTNNKYFQFSIAANPGTDVDLSSLTFNVARGGAGTPRGFFVKSSVDNFVGALAASGNPGLSANATNPIGNDINSARPNYTAVTIDLSAAGFQNIQNLASGVTFRVYAYAPSSGNSVDFDDLAINGTALAVPEPGTLALGGIGAAGLLARRGRRRK